MMTNREVTLTRALIESAQALTKRREVLGEILFGDAKAGAKILVGAEPSEVYAEAQRIVGVTVPQAVAHTDAIGYIVATLGGVEDRTGALTERETALVTYLLHTYRAVVNRETEIVERIYTHVEEVDSFDRQSMLHIESILDAELPQHTAHSLSDVMWNALDGEGIRKAVNAIDRALTDNATVQAAAAFLAKGGDAQ